MMMTEAGAEIQDGYVAFIGNPTDLQPGDLLLDNSFAVTDVKPAEHNREPATQVTVAISGDYEILANPPEQGRVVLLNSTSLKFRRNLYEDVDFGVEEELFQELVDCDHDEHEAYNLEWSGKCRDIPKGMLVGINLQPEGKPVQPTCQIVDSAYGSGMVLFENGKAFQSHPDKEWIGWVKEVDMRGV